MPLQSRFSRWESYGITCISPWPPAMCVCVCVLYRRVNHSFERALASQPVMKELQEPILHYIGAALFVMGNIFVLSSMWALGVTGTYLGNPLPPMIPFPSAFLSPSSSSPTAIGVRMLMTGDYFGILMEERVTSFPFNVLENPMYVGSAMSFFGTSLWYGKPVGFVLSIEVSVMYCLAMLLEGPFTTRIYEMRDEYLRRKAAKEAGKEE